MERAVILNLKQAQLFAEASRTVDEVISFCPSAAHFLALKNYRVQSTADLYQGVSHARTVALVAKELPLIVQAAATQYGLDASEKEGLGVYLYHLLCCLYHFHFSLRQENAPGKRLHWVEGKELVNGDYRDMFIRIAREPSKAILAYAYINYSAPHAWLAMGYNWVTGQLLSRSRRLKVIDYGDELPKRIARAMIDNGDAPLVINTHTLGKNAYRTTRFFIKSLARIFSGKADGKPVYLFRVTNPAQYQAKVKSFAVPHLFSPEVQAAVQKAVEKMVPFIRAETAIGRDIIRACTPHIAISDHAKYGYIIGGLEAMSRYGGQHAMLNHGTHTAQYEAISKLAATLWGAQERIINAHTTHSLPKSPLTEVLTKQIRPGNGYAIRKINVYGKIHNQASRDGRFVVLQAGNYTDAVNHIPWCKETGEEYLRAIVELLEEVASLENIELIIKLKNKKADTHKTIVEGHIRRLGIEDKARVDTTSKFSDLMERAHVVVCNLSGTIEEALANCIPLIIHTYRKSYYHIPEETVQAATIDGLAPAYLVKTRDDIGKIITQLSVRREGLNDPTLFKDVAWKHDELISMKELAAELVAASPWKRP